MIVEPDYHKRLEGSQPMAVKKKYWVIVLFVLCVVIIGYILYGISHGKSSKVEKYILYALKEAGLEEDRAGNVDWWNGLWENNKEGRLE